MKKKSARGKENRAGLVICGSGLFPLRDLTVGAVKALAGCSAVFYVHRDYARVALELKQLDSRIKLVPIFKGGRVDIGRLWGAIKKNLAAGRPTAYLTYGNPMLRGEGLELSERCRAGAFEVSVLPGVSSIDVMHAAPGLLSQALGRGYTLATAEDVATGRVVPHPRSTLVLMSAAEELDAGKFAALCKRLLGIFSPERSLFCVRMADPENKSDITSWSLSDLPGLKKNIPHRATLVLPYFHSEDENRLERKRRRSAAAPARNKYSPG